ncbi:MAG TPA: CDP-alcohol phosphatidyltransferase family protein [Acidimicrobiales bacterium]|nr:CDP-alcohol phosphatidyltransferase family protein [Acidimicrobiales bacterium]
MSATFGPSAVATPANGVTVARLLATPLLVVVVVERGPSWGALFAWVVLACSDGIDGWLARRHGVTTSGAFLDPLADKVLVLGALGAIAAEGWIPWVPVVIIATREVAMSVYRARVARHGISVPARPLAKLKTATQDLAVGSVLLPLTGLHHLWLGTDLLWAAVALAALSGGQYLLDSRRTPSPSGALSGAPSPSGALSGAPSPSGALSGAPSPSGALSGAPSPSGALSGAPSPSGASGSVVAVTAREGALG